MLMKYFNKTRDKINLGHFVSIQKLKFDITGTINNIRSFCFFSTDTFQTRFGFSRIFAVGYDWKYFEVLSALRKNYFKHLKELYSSDAVILT